MDMMRPIPIMFPIKADPPCETNGRGTPVRGSKSILMPIFSKTWNKIIMIIPVDT